MADTKIVQAQPATRNVETFIENYKKLNPEDVRDLDTLSYEDFRKAYIADPVKIMVEASDAGMDLEQYANLRSPSTKVEQGRSIIKRLMEDESMYVRDTDMSASCTVAECMDSPHRQGLLFHALTKAWEKNTIQDRGSITLPTSSPLHTPPNTATTGQPAPVAVGVRLNPGELVASTHSVNTNTYNPFKWDYDKEDMQRNKVKPAETIPASTLGESSGNIQMAKWGNRFVLPYELLTGGQGLRVNKLAQMVALDASTESVRQFSELLGVLEKGDGVTGAATSTGITSYGGITNEFGFVPFLNWLDEAIPAPFQISHVIMLPAQQRQLRTALAELDGNLAFQQLSSVGLAPNGLSNMEGQGTVRYGKAPAGSITTGHVIGVDSRYAIEKVNRAGMTIRQQAEQIANQTREVVISDTYLWARLAADAVRVLDITS